MLEYGLRFLAGGIAVSVFAALSDVLRPKSFAGLFGAAPSIALATLLLTLSQKGPLVRCSRRPFDDSRRFCARGLQLDGLRSAQKASNVIVDRVDGSFGCLVRCGPRHVRRPISTIMIIQFKLSALRQTRWYEYASGSCSMGR
jgi:hypothetical protein